MFYVYVLQSQKDFNVYIGSTKDLKNRFNEHNKGEVPSTHNRIPFHIIYYEAYASETDARNREKQLKLRGQARAHLMDRIKASLIRKET